MRVGRVACGGCLALATLALSLVFGVLPSWAGADGVATGPPKLVAIPGGEFAVGAREAPESGPWRLVQLPPFALAVRETSVDEFSRYAEVTGQVLPAQPGDSSPDYPVVNVTWFDAQAFCEFHGLDLPTEEQWEVAAWAGRQRLAATDQEEVPEGSANLEGTGGADRWEGPAPVGSFPANEYGVHDLFGNVWEWTNDAAPSPAGYRLLKGGAWYVCRNRVGATRRNSAVPSKRHPGIGFRCAGTLP